MNSAGMSPQSLRCRTAAAARQTAGRREREERMESLQDQVIAITGGSAGIGRATAVELVAAGARVVLGARRKERLDALAAEHAGRVIAVETDVRSSDDARALVQAGIGAFGRLDALVANAGIGMYGGILEHTDEE